MSNLKLKEGTEEVLKSLMHASIPSVAPGIVSSVIIDGRTFFRMGEGRMKDPNFEFTTDTIFDMASLTKPIITATLVMKYLERGEITLEDNLSSLGLFRDGEKAGQLTVKSLLTHSSGLIWHYHMYRIGKTRQDYLNTIEAFAAVSDIYSREEYSDLNYLTLAFLLEHLSGESLDALAERYIFKPLEMKHSGFNPVWEKDLVAPTEISSERGLLWGKVNDENSYYLGGVAGHAGLFSNLDDISKYVDGLLNNRLFSRKTLELMTTPANEYLGGTFGLGWMVKLFRPMNPSVSFNHSLFMGDYADIGTIGHTGFTGTSLVVDLCRKVAVVILSNRVYPNRENLNIQRFGRLFHNTVFRNIE